MYSNY
jgi:hypothetical protein